MCCGNGRDYGREMIGMKVLVNCDICKYIRLDEVSGVCGDG